MLERSTLTDAKRETLLRLRASLTTRVQRPRAHVSSVRTQRSARAVKTRFCFAPTPWMLGKIANARSFVHSAANEIFATRVCKLREIKLKKFILLSFRLRRFCECGMAWANLLLINLRTKEEGIKKWGRGVIWPGQAGIIVSWRRRLVGWKKLCEREYQFTYFSFALSCSVRDSFLSLLFFEFKCRTRERQKLLPLISQHF